MGHSSKAGRRRSSVVPQRSRKFTYSSAVLALIIIAYFALTLAFNYGNATTQPSDDNFYVNFSYAIANKGLVSGFHYLRQFDFNIAWITKYVFIAVPAFFYWIFGLNSTSEILYEVLCGCGAIIVIFLIGRRLHGDAAGLIAAGIFVLIPDTVLESASAGDGMPVAFFSLLAVLMLLMAMHDKRRAYYLLSGFFVVIGAIAGTELTLIVPVFIVPVMLYLLATDLSAERALNLGYFFMGIAAGLVIILVLGQVLAGAALQWYTMHFNSNWYFGGNWYYNQPTTLVSSWLQVMFPFSSSLPHTPWPWPTYISPWWILLPLNIIGFFGYAAIASIAYLAVKGERAVAFPVFWMVSLFLYLSFGTDRVYSWNFLPFTSRFFSILTPSISLCIGIALSVFLSQAGSMLKRGHAPLAMVAVAGVCVALVFLVANSISLTSTFDSALSLQLRPYISSEHFIDNLPQNSTVYVASILLNDSYYGSKAYSSTISNVSVFAFGDILAMNYGTYYRHIMQPLVFYNCSSLKSGSYIVQTDMLVDDRLYTSGQPYEPRNILLDCPGVKVVLNQPQSDNPMAAYGVEPLANLTIYSIS